MTSSPAELPVLAAHDADEVVELLEQLIAGARRPGSRPWEEAGGSSLELVAQLRLTASRQARVGAGGGAPAGPDTTEEDHGTAVAVRVAPLPYVANASDVAEQLHGLLSAWVARTMLADRDEAPIGPRRPAPTSLATAELAAWLRDRLPTLEQRPGSTREELAELRRLVRRGRGIIDRPADRWYAGPCSTPLRDDAGALVIVDGAQAYCTEDLYAAPGAKAVTCPACGALHHVDRRRDELLRLAGDRLLTAADLSRALAAIGNLECKPDRLRQWARRGRIVAHGTDADGRPLYRVGDAITLLAADADRADKAARKAAATREERAS